MRSAARNILIAAAVSAGLAGLAAHSRRVVRCAEAAFPPMGECVELAGGGCVHVVERGTGDPLVLIHGADGVVNSLVETIVDPLAAEHRVVAVDRPGHGWSALPPGIRTDVPTNLALIREAVGRLGVRRPIVVGHSYGGAVAIRWALDHPGEVRALVLLAPCVAFPWRVPAEVLRLVAVPGLGRVLTDALVVPLGGLVLGPASRNAFTPDPVPASYEATSRALFLRPAQFRALAAEYANLRRDMAELEPRFGELDIPVVIVSAEGDRVTRPQHHARPLAEAVPGAELVELPERGHELIWYSADAVVEAVRRVEDRLAQGTE